MTRIPLSLALLMMAAGSGAAAQEGPTFDCARAEHEAETIICNDAELSALDRALGATFEAAVSAARGLDAGAEAAEAELRATQRGWIGGRDDCWMADDKRACIVESYRRREAELVATYQLMEPSSVATWTCDGDPANEVTTYFYDTPLPSVRIERGDTVDVGTLAPSGSGSLYEGSFGRSIWLHGDEATYREADPDGAEVSCTTS